MDDPKLILGGLPPLKHDEVGLGYPYQAPKMRAIFEELLRIFTLKSQEYGPDAVWSLGLKGRYCEVDRKVMRLKHLIWEIPPKEWDLGAIVETAQDLTNYGALLLMVVETIKEGRVPQG